MQFTKAQAGGNDLIVVFDPLGEVEFEDAAVQRICDRHVGVGASGILRIVGVEHLSAASRDGRETVDEIVPGLEWAIELCNADGSVAAASSDGLRIATRYLTERGHVELSPGETLSLMTASGVRDVQRTGTGGFQTDLGRWRLGGGEPLVAAAGLHVARPGLGIELGSPHIVVALADAAELQGLDLQQVPEIEPAPIDGATISFVVPHDPLVREGVGWLSARVYERGVGETPSNSSAAAATALAVRHWLGGGASAPQHWRLELSGGPLQVRMFPTEEGEHVGLAGPAVLVFDGELIDY